VRQPPSGPGRPPEAAGAQAGADLAGDAALQAADGGQRVPFHSIWSEADALTCDDQFTETKPGLLSHGIWFLTAEGRVCLIETGPRTSVAAIDGIGHHTMRTPADPADALGELHIKGTRQVAARLNSLVQMRCEVVSRP
jgi:hypothetical protein